VIHGAESFQGPGTYPLSGGVVCDQFGMILFQLLEFPKKGIILPVSYFRIIQNVVAVVVVVELFPESLDLFPYINVHFGVILS
jgi:hypothetical protein